MAHQNFTLFFTKKQTHHTQPPVSAWQSRRTHPLIPDQPSCAAAANPLCVFLPPPPRTLTQAAIAPESPTPLRCPLPRQLGIEQRENGKTMLAVMETWLRPSRKELMLSYILLVAIC